MPKFERHVFICNNERPEGASRPCCGPRGGFEIRALLKQELNRRGLKGRVRANQAGCLDQCEHGPNIVVYPDNVWYGFVKPEDVAEIVESHIINGVPVARLVLPDSCLNISSCPHKTPKPSKTESKSE